MALIVKFSIVHCSNCNKKCTFLGRHWLVETITSLSLVDTDNFEGTFSLGLGDRLGSKYQMSFRKSLSPEHPSLSEEASTFPETHQGLFRNKIVKNGNHMNATQIELNIWIQAIFICKLSFVVVIKLMHMSCMHFYMKPSTKFCHELYFSNS